MSRTVRKRIRPDEMRKQWHNSSTLELEPYWSNTNNCLNRDMGSNEWTPLHALQEHCRWKTRSIVRQELQKMRAMGDWSAADELSRLPLHNRTSLRRWVGAEWRRLN